MKPRNRHFVASFTHRTTDRLEDIALHSELGDLLALPCVLLAQPAQLVALGLAQTPGRLRVRPGPRTVDPVLQRALVHAQVPRDLRRRLPPSRSVPPPHGTPRRTSASSAS